VSAVQAVLKRFNKREDLRDIFEDKWTVSEKIQSIMEALAARPKLSFAELFATSANRAEVVVTFLALLELIRLKQVVAIQPEAFGEIEIGRAPASLPEPATVVREASAASDQSSLAS
jgi:segregation and condensation protein A